MINTKESGLESRIEKDLIKFGGYEKYDGVGYDRHLALCSETLISYVKNTQASVWDKYVKIYGDKAGKSFIDRFVKEVKVKGLIKVLRTGITDRGCMFKVVTFAKLVPGPLRIFTLPVVVTVLVVIVVYVLAPLGAWELDFT